MARWGESLVALALLAAAGDAHADGDHVVINVVNRLVYVSLGTRDGASVGDEIDVMADGVVLGKIELDLCGEVICRGKLPNSLATKVVRGMSVRVTPGTEPTAPSATKPSATKPSATKPSATKPSATKPSATNGALPIFKPSPNPYAPNDDEGPARLPYRTPIPPGYRVSRQRSSVAVTVGWIGLSVTYGVSFLIAVNGHNESALLLPVFGPFLHAATNRSTDSNSGYILLGVGQAVSLVFLIAGYSGERVLVKQGTTSLNIGPSGLIGRF